MKTAEDLLKFFDESSVKWQDEWLRLAMLEHDGILTLTTDRVVRLREGVILTPYASRSAPEKKSRILFELRDHPIIREHAYARAMATTADHEFSVRYSDVTVGFRHYSDITIIRLTYQLVSKVEQLKGIATVDASKVVEGLLTFISPEVKPDQRRSIQAIKLAGLLTEGKISIGDFAWINAHVDISNYVKLGENLKTLNYVGYYWHTRSERRGVVSVRTCGLSALGKQEIGFRFQVKPGYESAHVDPLLRIRARLDDLLINDAVKFGMETMDMKRDILRIIKECGLEASYKETENCDALVSSVWPRQQLTFTIDVR